MRRERWLGRRVGPVKLVWFSVAACVLTVLLAVLGTSGATVSPAAAQPPGQGRLLIPRPVVDMSQSLPVSARFGPPRPGRLIRLQLKREDGWQTVDGVEQGASPIVRFVLPAGEPRTARVRAVASRTQTLRRQQTRPKIVRWASPHEAVAAVPGACCVNTFYTDLDLSADGRWVAQRLDANPFEPPKHPYTSPLVLYDRVTRVATRITNHDATSPSISANGERIAYGAVPRSYYGTGKSWTYGLYVWDRSTGQRTRLVTPTGYANVRQIDLSANGRWVAFESEAAKPEPGARPARDADEKNVFLMKVGTQNIRRLAGPTGPAFTSDPSINRDGSVIVYHGGDPVGPDGQPGDPTRKGPFLWERGQGSVQLFAPRRSVVETDLDLAGEHLAYAANEPGESKFDVFWRDLRTGEDRLVFDNTVEGEQGHLSQGPVISGSGRFVSWVSWSGPDDDPRCEIECLRRWDSRTGETITVQEAQYSDPTFLRTDRTGTLLAYAGGVSEEADGTILKGNAGVDFAPYTPAPERR